MKIRSAELSGKALRWAVAKVAGQPTEVYLDDLFVPGFCGETWTRQQYLAGLKRWEPDTNWNQIGPLIFKYKIDLQHKINAGSDYDECAATIGIGSKTKRRYGDTPQVPLAAPWWLTTWATRLKCLTI